MIIQVNTDLDNNINEYINDFNMDKENVENILRDISSIWKGSDYDNFQKKMDSFLTVLDKFKNQINNYQKFITGYLKALTTLDEVYGTKSLDLK